MISKELVTVLVKEKIEERNCFLVDVKVSPSNDIIILFDKKEGVSFEDCLIISRYLEENLDRSIEDYKLNVSSPGIESSFKVIQQYLKNIDRQVQVETIDGNRVNGRLISFGEQLVLQKERNRILEDITIPVDQIKETKLVLKFK